MAGKKGGNPSRKPGISSYDIIGDIAVIEIPRGSKARPREIAQEIVMVHPRIKTVLAKTGERSGEFRLRGFRKILGKETETVHREHGFRFRLDPTKVYFSPRESTERERIASMVGPGETVMVLFAGAGPFGIVIAGKQPGVGRVYQVEINPRGFEYMKQNIAMNRLSHLVIPVRGDARKVCRDYQGTCDRVVMPLPREGHRFLGDALKCLKRRGYIHFYSIGRTGRDSWGRRADQELFGQAIDRLEKAARRLKRRVRILSKRRVLPYGPGKWKICIDAEIRTTDPKKTAQKKARRKE
jgi:tRNA (guanine37-N1)-methyltransferase